MRALLIVFAIAACGPPAPWPQRPQPASEITTRWFRAPDPCGVGPYEIAIDIPPTRYGEKVTFVVASPRRRVELEAVILEDGREVERRADIFDSAGVNRGPLANGRCLAPAIIAMPTPASEPPPPPPPPVGPTTQAPPPPADPAMEAAAEQLVELDPGLVTGLSATIVHHYISATPARVVIRFWSHEPNDLTNVRFGLWQELWNRPPVD